MINILKNMFMKSRHQPHYHYSSYNTTQRALSFAALLSLGCGLWVWRFVERLQAKATLARQTPP